MVSEPIQEDIENMKRINMYNKNLFGTSTWFPLANQGALPKPGSFAMYDHPALNQIQYGEQLVLPASLPNQQKRNIYGRII